MEWTTEPTMHWPEPIDVPCTNMHSMQMTMRIRNWADFKSKVWDTINRMVICFHCLVKRSASVVASPLNNIMNQSGWTALGGSNVQYTSNCISMNEQAKYIDYPVYIFQNVSRFKNSLTKSQKSIETNHQPNKRYYMIQWESDQYIYSNNLIFVILSHCFECSHLHCVVSH